MRKIKLVLMNMVALLATMFFWGFLAQCVAQNATIGMGVGAMLFGGVKVAQASGFTTSGLALVGVYVEVWTGELVKQFNHADQGSFLDGIRDYSQYADKNIIHLVDVGIDPEVLINNTTYPIETQETEDGDISITLDKYQTKKSEVTDDELYGASYDIIALRREQQGTAIVTTRQDKALHALAPAANTADTPVLKTTGEVVDGRKRLTRKDVIALKTAFDKALIPQKGRRLVLCPDHIDDLLQTDQKFADQYHNYTSGKIYAMFGFEIYEYTKSPYYTLATLSKKAFKSVPDAAADKPASVAFVPSECFKAMGDTKMYWAKAENNPSTQKNEINFRHYFVVLPKKQRAIGAIVSDNG